MAIGERIKKWRTERKLTQAEAAAAFGLKSHVYVSRYESGEREPSIDELSRMADAIGTTIDDLVGRAKPTPPTADTRDLTIKKMQARQLMGALVLTMPLDHVIRCAICCVRHMQGHAATTRNPMIDDLAVIIDGFGAFDARVCEDSVGSIGLSDESDGVPVFSIPPVPAGND